MTFFEIYFKCKILFSREGTRRNAKRRNEETKKRRERMVSMGNTLMKDGTMFDPV